MASFFLDHAVYAHGTSTLQTDRQTDIQTDGRTDGRLTIAIPRFALRASRGKNDVQETVKSTDRLNF